MTEIEKLRKVAEAAKLLLRWPSASRKRMVSDMKFLAAALAAPVEPAPDEVGPCDDCGKPAGIRVCTGCYERAKADGPREGAEWMREQERHHVESNGHIWVGGKVISGAIRPLPTSPPAPEEDK